MIICSTMIFSCARFETFEEKEFDGEKFMLQQKETKGFSTNSFKWRFRLEGHPYVNINPMTKDWGPPFSTDVFGGNSFIYITDQDTAYINPMQSDRKTNTFLYLDPDKYSEEEFEIYSDFMKKHWAEIDAKYGGNDLRTFPGIIGLAYCKQENPTYQFRGKLKYLGTGEEKPYLLEIANDGRIRLMQDEKRGNDAYSGLSEQVEMPGKIIRFKKERDYSLDDLKTLKNQYGTDFTHYFKVVEE